MPELIGGLGALFVVVLYVAVVVLGLGLPFMVFSATRNLKKIREQFERLNALLEHNAAAAAPPVARREFTPAATSDNRTATARPGALGI